MSTDGENPFEAVNRTIEEAVEYLRTLGAYDIKFMHRAMVQHTLEQPSDANDFALWMFGVCLDRLFDRDRELLEAIALELIHEEYVQSREVGRHYLFKIMNQTGDAVLMNSIFSSLCFDYDGTDGALKAIEANCTLPQQALVTLVAQVMRYYLLDKS